MVENQVSFLATLVALHFTPVSERVAGQSFGLQPSSVAWSLRACSYSPSAILLGTRLKHALYKTFLILFISFLRTNLLLK